MTQTYPTKFMQPHIVRNIQENVFEVHNDLRQMTDSDADRMKMSHKPRDRDVNPLYSFFLFFICFCFISVNVYLVCRTKNTTPWKQGSLRHDYLMLHRMKNEEKQIHGFCMLCYFSVVYQPAYLFISSRRIYESVYTWTYLCVCLCDVPTCLLQ